MKHALAIFAALVLSVSCLGAELDFSSMSTEDIYAVIDAARAEVESRKQKEDFVVVDQDGFKLSLSGKKEFTESNYLYLKGTIVNTSDKYLDVGFDECYVNGWKSNARSFPNDVAPGKKAKIDLSISCDGIVKKAKKVEDVLLYIYLKDEDYNYIQVPTMRLTFSEGKLISIDQEDE